jgi:hypothetical protein
VNLLKEKALEEQHKVHDEMSPFKLISQLFSYDYISGPVNWYSFNANIGDMGPRTFNFFGDAHFSKEKSCSDKPLYKRCLTIGPDLKLPNIEKTADNCADITYALVKLFDNSVTNQIYADFFIELPFHNDSYPDLYAKKVDRLAFALRNNPSSEDLHEYDKLDYIHSLYVIFYPCLQKDKSECKYSPYVRFHYSDIRQTMLSGIITINDYLFFASQNILQTLDAYYKMEMLAELGLYVDEPIDIESEIAKGNFLFDIFLKLTTSGRTLSGITEDYNSKIFNTYLYSDDFQNDIYRLMTEIVSPNYKHNIEYVKFLLFIQTMSQLYTIKDGKNVSRLRAQLLALRQNNIIHNGENMADIIERFLLDKYNKINITEIYKPFTRFVDKILKPLSSFKLNRNIKHEYAELLSLSDDLRVSDRFISADALLLDGYLLARMFRTFSATTDSHQISQDVYTYTGALHTRNYAEFFTDYLNVPLIHKHDNLGNDMLLSTPSMRCLQKNLY